MKPQFPFLIAAMFLLVIVPSYAQFNVEITIIAGVEPQVRAVFNETVILRNATIFKVSNMWPPIITDTIGTEKEPPEATVTTYMITPVRALTNGDYLIQLVAADFVGNELTFVRAFTVSFPETDIRVINPPLGVSNQTPFDLTIQTIREDIPRPTDCKFSSFDPRENFNAFGLQLFDDPPAGVMSAVHTITGFSTRAGLVPNVEGPGFYVICLDDLGRANQKRVFSMIDTISPVIEFVSFDPARIIEYPIGGGQFATIATLRASEPVICRYSLNESRPFGDMTPFIPYDEDNVAAFQATATQSITLPDGDGRTYTIYFICRDRAGQRSPEFSREIHVDLSAAIGINVVSPPAFSTGQALNLTLTTDKTSWCEAMYEGETFQLTTEANPAKFHTQPLAASPPEGIYTISVTCRSGQAGMFQEQTVSHQFTVDKSPPSSPLINGSTVSCQANPLRFAPPITFTATDAQSGIREYRYTIAQFGVNQTGSMINEVTPPGAANVSNATVATYTLSVSAVNNAGLIGTPITTSISVNALHPLCLEKDPPEVTISEERQALGEVRITMVCADESGCDNSTFLYGFSDNQSCAPFSAYTTPFSIFRTQTICYSVRDTVGNNASGSQRITVDVANTCTNNAKDGDETDVDCGGSCGSSCIDGKVCRADRDCFNLFCSNGICRAPTCTDTLLNNQETDIDCGGSRCTVKCDAGKQCAQHNDCRGNFCNPETRRCDVSSCTDGVVGGNESDIDCGGDCQACGENQRCRVDGDCSTNKCEFGYCKQETAPTPPAPPEASFPQKIGNFFLSWGFIILGLLCVVGGSGYLYYKKMHPTYAAKPIATTGKLPPRPLTREELERKKAEEERRKKLEEAVKQRLAREEQERKEKRMKLFQTFEAPGAKPAERAPERIPLPAARKEGVKEEWVPLEKLGEKTKGLPAKPKPQAAAEEEFERLGKIAKGGKTEEDVFAKLPIKERAAEKPEEDVFAKLPRGEEIDHDLLKRITEQEEKRETERSLKTARKQAKKRR